jgi:hypothetical protein
VLHEECELRCVQCGVVLRVGGVGVSATPQVCGGVSVDVRASMDKTHHIRAPGIPARPARAQCTPT